MLGVQLTVNAVIASTTQLGSPRNHTPALDSGLPVYARLYNDAIIQTSLHGCRPSAVAVRSDFNLLRTRCVDLWSVLIKSSYDRDCRTDRLAMFTVYYLTQVAQIHRESTVRLPAQCH